MKLLLDTHIFLWLRNDSKKVSPQALTACRNRDNILYLSIASIWEIQIKHQLGKLQLSVSLEELLDQQCRENGLQLLPVETKHILALYQLPWHHKDPFDRILIAQTMVEEAYLVSADDWFKEYPVKLLW